MQITRYIWLSFFTILLLASCGPKEGKKSDPQPMLGGGGTSPGSVTQPNSGTGSLPTPTPAPQTTPPPLVHDFALIRLSPEEFSGQIAKAFDYQYGWENHLGQFQDAIVEFNGVALGGVDFRQVRQRDPTPKVTTILTIRNLAYQIANGIVERDRQAQEANSASVVFSHVEMVQDRPLVMDDYALPADILNPMIAGEKRWERQVEDLYWRLYNRPPAPDELTTMRQTFTEYMAINSYPPNGWRFILYAMLSSMEAWYR